VLDRLELIRDENGTPVRINGSWNDITARKEMEEALRISEERFIQSQKFANIGTWDWDIQTGDLHWSDRIAPLFGYPEGNLETTYENFIAAVHREDRQAVSDAVTDCVESGKEYKIEHRVVWPDGTVRWLLETGDVTRNEDGTPLHMLGVVQDIHERKMAQQELEFSEALLKDAQQMANMGHWSLDIASGALFWSDEIYRIFGYAPNEFAPSYQQFFDAVHPDDVEKIKQSEKEAYENNTKHSIDHRIIRPDGSIRWVHEEAKTEYDKHGKAIRLSGTVQDITKRKDVEDALVLAKEEAEKANRAKSEFLSSMSHELRTPLNAVIGFSQLLESDDELTEEQVENAKEIHHAGRHLLELINDVLDLSKIESGHIAIQNQNLHLQDIINECVILTASLADQHGVLVDYVSDVTLQDMLVHADVVRLKQAILNLLSNAIKYNVPNGKVHIYTRIANDGFVRISIEDTGNGIPQDKIDDLYIPFNRLGKENSGIEGSGIGLVITRTLIELMGGTLDFETKEGVGSVFSFCLKAVGSESDKNESMQMKQSNIEKQSAGKKIIYIEDNPANLRLVEKIIRKLDGVVLVTAVEPESGIALVKDHMPDLILLDINLPGMSGYDVIKEIRGNSETSLIPVIAVSANAMESDIAHSREVGFDDYITKPLNIPKFCEIVGRYI
jgi:PAS domain S-box-containing protein